jgi:hypothetical protein
LPNKNNIFFHFPFSLKLTPLSSFLFLLYFHNKLLAPDEILFGMCVCCVCMYIKNLYWIVYIIVGTLGRKSEQLKEKKEEFSCLFICGRLRPLLYGYRYFFYMFVE